ncbi:MAG: tRNA (adenosine(37)-N6)-dimethylallyltransferase MiaA [Pseudomonadota bacterium]
MAATLIAIMGPTACGKTALASALCQRLDTPVISVDSAMVYRAMDIGTAKPTRDELAAAPHRLIDLVDPGEVYSAGQFRRDALAEIERVHSRGRPALLAGGTMLYFRALLNGIDPLPSADASLRARLDAEAADLGWPALHRRLAEVDPAAAERIHVNDAQRIQRALEVHALSGRPISEWQTRAATPLPGRVVRVALIPGDRAALHARIEARFDLMLDSGFIEEVAGLLSRYDLDTNTPCLRAVGYRQIAAHLRGELSFDQAREDAITATRRLARRQLTWLRRESDVERVDPDRNDPIPEVLRRLDASGVAVHPL